MDELFHKLMDHVGPRLIDQISLLPFSPPSTLELGQQHPQHWIKTKQVERYYGTRENLRNSDLWSFLQVSSATHREAAEVAFKTVRAGRRDLMELKSWNTGILHCIKRLICEDRQFDLVYPPFHLFGKTPRYPETTSHPSQQVYNCKTPKDYEQADTKLDRPFGGLEGRLKAAKRYMDEFHLLTRPGALFELLPHLPNLTFFKVKYWMHFPTEFRPTLSHNTNLTEVVITTSDWSYQRFIASLPAVRSVRSLKTEYPYEEIGPDPADRDGPLGCKMPQVQELKVRSGYDRCWPEAVEVNYSGLKRLFWTSCPDRLNPNDALYNIVSLEEIFIVDISNVWCDTVLAFCYHIYCNCWGYFDIHVRIRERMNMLKTIVEGFLAAAEKADVRRSTPLKLVAVCFANKPVEKDQSSSVSSSDSASESSTSVSLVAPVYNEEESEDERLRDFFDDSDEEIREKRRESLKIERRSWEAAGYPREPHWVQMTVEYVPGQEVLNSSYILYPFDYLGRNPTWDKVELLNSRLQAKPRRSLVIYEY